MDQIAVCFEVRYSSMIPTERQARIQLRCRNPEINTSLPAKAWRVETDTAGRNPLLMEVNSPHLHIHRDILRRKGRL